MKKTMEKARQKLFHQQKIEICHRKLLLIAGKKERMKVKVKMKHGDAEPSVQLDGDRKPE